MTKKLTVKILVMFLVLLFCFALPATASGGNYYLGAAGDGITYLLNAPFTADNQTFSDAQVLDTTAEGITTGSLKIKDTDAGDTIRIVSNQICLGDTAGGWNTSGFWGAAVTRTLGTGFFFDFNKSATNNSPYVGLRIAQDANYTNEFGFAFRNLEVRRDTYSAGRELILFIQATATDYSFAGILGGYSDDGAGVQYKEGDLKTSYEYGGFHFVKGGAFATWTLLYKESIGTTGTLYFGAGDNTTTDNCLDNVKITTDDLSSVLQPANLSLFAGAGTELSAYTPDVGGAWTENSGDWDTNGAGALVNTTAGYATLTGVADEIFEVKITIPANDAGADCAWIIVRGDDYTGASEDYEGIKICDETAGNDFEYIQYVAGVPTTLAGADNDWVGGTSYMIRIIVAGNNVRQACSDDSGDTCINYTTANNNGTSNTGTGLRDEGNAVFTFDNVGVWLRTSASQYDAVLDLY